jgi:hypothetical protein
MHTRTVTIGDGDDRALDLRDPEQIRTAGEPLLALTLLRVGWQAETLVSRRALIRELSAGLEPPTQDTHVRRLAEAFQTLEALRLVCADVVQPQDEFRFLTSRGRWILNASSPLEELRRELRGT